MIMGLKTAILRVSKKWEGGGRGSVCYGKLLEKIRNDCVHILILSHGSSFWMDWSMVSQNTGSVKIPRNTFFMTKMKIAWFI